MPSPLLGPLAPPMVATRLAVLAAGSGEWLVPAAVGCAAGLLLGAVITVGRWRRGSARRRRAWLRRAEDAFRGSDPGPWRELVAEEGFRDALGDWTQLRQNIETHVIDSWARVGELEEELEQARLCFEALPQPGIILDVHDHVLGATPDARRLLGRSSRDLVGQRLDRFVKGDLAGDPPYRVEILHPTDEPRPADLHLRNVGDRRANYRIGLLLAPAPEATPGAPAPAAEESPRPTRTLEAMGEFAGSVAHDFNDQLTTILGHSCLLLGRAEDETLDRESIEAIVAAAEQARLTTRQLLAFSRRQAVHPEVVDVPVFLQDLVPEIRGLLGMDVTLEIECTVEAAGVRVDPYQLQAALKHLVRNAGEAMAYQGHLRMQVDCIAELPPNLRGSGAVSSAVEAWIRLAIIDSGPGMAPECFPRAFEPYFTSRPGEGRRGMGLPTVYGIVTQAHGFVAMANAIDRGFEDAGLVFEIFFPVAPAEEPRGSAASHPPLTSGSRPCVCVVEDDLRVQHLVESILEGEGFDVLTAGDGREALQLCTELAGEVDLVLTDVHLPVMGGLELAQELHRRGPSPPTIFMSGFIEHEGIVREPESTISFLQKPFTPRELLEHVRSGLQGMGRGIRARRRALVVDGEEGIRDLLGRLLAGLGYDCHAAGDGERAMWMLEGEETDVIISDMSLTDPRGVRTCLELRSAHPHVPLIAMSDTSAGAAHFEVARRWGVAAILAKPFSRDELALALEQALGSGVSS